MTLTMLVPLDRSSFAEEALLLALNIARKSGGRVDLVQVHAQYGKDDPTLSFVPYQPELEERTRQEERAYLRATSHWAHTQSSVPVTGELLPGSAVLPETVGETILERARNGNADMIVMATHGRGLFARLGEGSVADELLRHSRQPLLLVRPAEHQDRGTRQAPYINHILILLDGSTLSEEILKPTIDLARSVNSRCTLLRVVTPRTAPDHPGTPEVMEARAYLDPIVESLRKQGVDADRHVMVARSVEEAVRREVESEGCDLIALATHGRGGIQRMLLGSVATTLLQKGTTPLLIVNPRLATHD